MKLILNRIALLAILVCILFIAAFQSHVWFKAVLDLPIYFHVLVLVNLGIWLWAINLHFLNLSGIDTYFLLEDPLLESLLSAESSSPRVRITRPSVKTLPHISLAKQTYSLAGIFSVITLVSLSAFSYVTTTWGNDAAEYVPLLTYVVMIGTIILPFNVFYLGARSRFLSSFIRSAFGGLSSPVPFSDVILTDILTSFSKVMGDMQLVFCDLLLPRNNVFHPNSHASDKSSQAVLSTISSILVALPFVFRFRQCLAEWKQSNVKADQHRHLLNALKYATAFPVIFSGHVLNEARRLFKTSSMDQDRMQASVAQFDGAIRIWILFSAINSLYSLYWDIFVDWQLGTITNGPSKKSEYTPASSSDKGFLTEASIGSPGRRRSVRNDATESSISKSTSDLFASPDPFASSSTQSRFFLRPVLYYRHYTVYYIAIILDTILRLSWIVKVTLLYELIHVFTTSSHQSDSNSPSKATTEMLVAIDVLLKVLELIRRWMWVFFRVEREWVNKRDVKGMMKSVSSSPTKTLHDVA